MNGRTLAPTTPRPPPPPYCPPLQPSAQSICVSWFYSARPTTPSPLFLNHYLSLSLLLLFPRLLNVSSFGSLLFTVFFYLSLFFSPTPWPFITFSFILSAPLPPSYAPLELVPHVCLMYSIISREWRSPKRLTSYRK